MNEQCTYNIGYQGGSGGFLFLHCLLLSKQYHVSFLNKEPYEFVINHQWNIKNPSEWKSTEVWPNNFDTLNYKTDLKKILYYCNPSIDDFFKDQNIVNVIIDNYKNIKDSSWVAVNSIDDINHLPENVLYEFFYRADCKNVIDIINAPRQKRKFIWVYTDFQSQNELAYYKKAYYYNNKNNKLKINDFKKYTEIWNNTLVDNRAVYFLKNTDVQIKLQDLVNFPEIIVDYGLSDRVHQSQLDLINHWKGLHSPEILEIIGIK